MLISTYRYFTHEGAKTLNESFTYHHRSLTYPGTIDLSRGDALYIQELRRHLCET